MKLHQLFLLNHAKSSFISFFTRRAFTSLVKLLGYRDHFHSIKQELRGFTFCTSPTSFKFFYKIEMSSDSSKNYDECVDDWSFLKKEQLTSSWKNKKSFSYQISLWNIWTSPQAPPST